MKKSEREVLNQAADIIAREFADGRPVRIRGFGMFYVSDLRISLNVNQKKQTHVRGIVRFRPFGALKKLVGRTQPRCPAERKWWLGGDTFRCVKRDDHGDSHVDERGRAWR